MLHNRKPDSFIKSPKYPGGKKALDEFIKSNLKYPEEAMKNRIEGTVSVEYDVDVFGTVILAKVKHGIGYGCDEEAIRLTKLLKYEKKMYKGMRVTFHQKINIHFRLTAASKPVPKEQTIVYSYITDDSKKKSSGYTIKIDTSGPKN